MNIRQSFTLLFVYKFYLIFLWLSEAQGKILGFEQKQLDYKLDQLLVKKNLFKYVMKQERTKCPQLDPEVNMNVTQLLTSKGYPCEDYTVETKDGFLLSVQRVTHGLNNKNVTNRPVVFLQHGLLCTSTNWVTNLINESLAFILADEGYEVWMGNSRGNTYSRRHKTLSPDQDEFWAWSWDEMGEYDFPAMIDFALNVSGKTSLYYVGHSQGTTQAFVHLSQNPEFGEKIKLFFALAPVATVGSMESPIRYLSALKDETIYEILKRRDFLPSNRILDILADTVCRSQELRFLCANVLFLIAGYDTSNLNNSRLPVYINHTPAGCSVQDLIHYLQGYRSGIFRKYDYGSADQNEKHYGQPTPPQYNVSRITAPVALFYGDNDWLADLKDVALLIPKIQNLKAKIEVPQWNHLDFIWGENAATKVYNTVIQMIKDNP
ncbi:gastric triacylglycerol lipase [Patella vulgata]|uniref:gastric triacylglycerol lipase n=1 Tax=Patella vulgata TaxID=6465 RepID=UPI00217F855A|nr:gastric triacylglycerol lipase [Patella vulgata]